MNYQTCNTLFPTRDAAIRAIIAAWLDLPRLADCTEPAADLVAQARSDGWFSEFEAQYGAIDDADVAEFIDEMRDDARAERWADECESFDVWGISADGEAFESTAAEMLHDNEGNGEVEQAIRDLMNGARVVVLGGGAAATVTLAHLTDDEIRAALAEGDSTQTGSDAWRWGRKALDDDDAARVRLALAVKVRETVSGVWAGVAPAAPSDVVALTRDECEARGITGTAFGLKYHDRLDVEDCYRPHHFIIEVEHTLTDRDRVWVPGSERWRAVGAFLALCDDPAFARCTVTLCVQTGAIDPAIKAQRVPHAN